MYLHHRIDYFRRSASVTDTPAGHGECLGKTVQKNRALFHSGQRCYTCVLSVVGQLRIYLITQHQQVVPFCDIGNGFKPCSIHHGSRRIARRIEDEELRFGRDCRFELFGRNFKARPFARSDEHRHTAARFHNFGIGEPIRRRNDDFIALFQKSITYVEYGVLGTV